MTSEADKRRQQLVNREADVDSRITRVAQRLSSYAVDVFQMPGNHHRLYLTLEDAERIADLLDEREDDHAP